jgi:WD40 repeat protein
VPIYEFGEHDGAHFLAMRFMEGGTLQMRGHRAMEPMEVARLVATIADALQYAHGHGVLHRDLKPGNILIDKDGQPYVADFGLARVSAEDSDLTISNAVLGTAPYVSPEVAARGAGAATTASDIYGLGAILYELLAGRAPFTGATIAEVLRKVQETEPLPPSQVMAEAKSGVREALAPPDQVGGRKREGSGRMTTPVRIPRDLETICLKCLEKEPAKRYSTAQDLADDLNRFLRSEPILARPTSPTERVWRWCQRKPVVAGLVVALHLAFAIGLAGVLWQWRRAERNATNEASARQFAQAESYTADMNLVLQAWEEGNLRRARDLLLKHVPRPGEPNLRGFEWRYLWDICRDQSQSAFTNFDNDIVAVTSSLDGRCFAVATGRAIKLVDTDAGRELAHVRNIDTNDTILRLAISPKASNVVAATSQSGVLRLWNLATGQNEIIAEHFTGAEAMAFSPDGELLATTVPATTADRDFTVWKISSRRQLWSTNTAVPPRALAFSPDGASLVSGGGSGNGNAKVWDARTGKELSPFPAAHKGWMWQIVFSPDGKTLATSAADDKVILWDFATRRQKAPPIWNGGAAVAFSPDGQLLACIGSDQVARVWQLEPLQLIAVLRGFEPVWWLSFTPDSKRVVCGWANDTLRVWDASGMPDRNTLKHEHWVHQVAFSPNGQTLVSVDAEDFSKVWNVQSRRLVKDLPGGGLYGGGAAFSPNGQLLVTSSYSGKILLWDAATLEARGVLTNDFGVSSLSFSPNGKVLAVAKGFSTISRTDVPSGLAFWDVLAGKKLARLADAGPDAASVSFSRDGHLVAVGYYTGWVRLWHWETGHRLAEFRKHDGQVQTIAFSHDGALLASGGDNDGNVVLYTVASLHVQSVLKGHRGGVKCIAFAPDGKTLASGGNDGTIKLWNLDTYEPALILKKHSGNIPGLTFTQDGNLLASCGGDGDVRLWPAPALKEIHPTGFQQTQHDDNKKEIK